MLRTSLAARVRPNLRLLLAAALGGVLLGAQGCQLGSDASTPKGPVRLSIGYANPRLYNATYGGVPALLSSMEDERLLRPTPEGRFDPALAERWEQSADGLTWSFFLRPGLTFQDGTPIDAAVVAKGLSQTAATSTHPGLHNILKTEAQGPRTVVIQLRRPSTFILDALAFESIRSPGPKSSGAGPFHIDKQSQGSASMTGFAGYYRGRPAIDEVEIRPFENARSAWSAMMRGEIDVLFEVTPDAMDFVEGSSATQMRAFLRPYIYVMGTNLKHPILGRRDVRVALSQAVNRDDIVKGPLGGKGEAATSAFWPRHWAVDPHAPAFQYAPGDAARLLDAAGLPIKSAGAHRMPSRFRFTCLLSSHNARFERMGLMLQRQLIEVGIDMEMESLPATAFLQRVSAGDYEAYLMELASYNFEWAYMFWHSPQPGAPSLFPFGYRAADAALDRLSTARTDDETRAAVRDLQHVMYEDPPTVFLGWGRVARAVSTRFQLPTAPERDVMSLLSQWRPAGGRPDVTGERTSAAPATPSPVHAASASP